MSAGSRDERRVPSAERAPVERQPASGGPPRPTDGARAADRAALDGVVVRPCTREDLRRLEWDGLFTHHREIVEGTYRAQLEGHQLMLVADVDGAPQGQAWIDFRREAARGAAVVWAMRVHPTMRGRGIGTRVMLAAEDRIRAHGLAAAEVVVEVDNRPAQRFYERLGYRRIRRVAQSYAYTTPDGDAMEHHLDLFEMRKELDGRCPDRP